MKNNLVSWVAFLLLGLALIFVTIMLGAVFVSILSGRALGYHDLKRALDVFFVLAAIPGTLLLVLIGATAVSFVRGWAGAVRAKLSKIPANSPRHVLRSGAKGLLFALSVVCVTYGLALYLHMPLGSFELDSLRPALVFIAATTLAWSIASIWRGAAYSGPEILSRYAEGQTSVRPTTGAAPSRPRTAANLDATHEKVRAMSRRAALFLFDHYGFTTVPGQFWAVLENSLDPAIAFERFIRDLGCDPLLIQKRDPREEERARDLVDLLVRCGDALRELDPKAQRILHEHLQSGDYATVIAAARTIASLRAVLDTCARWANRPKLRAFEEAIRSADPILRNPVRVSPDDVNMLSELIARLSEGQSRFDEHQDAFKSVSDELSAIWPSAWHTTVYEDRRRKHSTEFLRTADSLRKQKDLTSDQLEAEIRGLRAHIDDLRELLARAQHFRRERQREEEASAREHFTYRQQQSRRAEQRAKSELDIALEFFGFSKERTPSSKEELRGAFRKEMKRLHPDMHPGATEAQTTRLNAECLRCQVYYSYLMKYFRWG